MAESKTCSQCGAPLPADADLACPRCLLAAGLTDSEPHAGAVQAPSPEDIAPRVKEMLG